MARRKKSRGRRRQKIPIAASVGLIVALKKTWNNRANLDKVLDLWTGWNGSDWNWRRADALVAAGAGAGVSMVASKVGLNRYVKIPYVKI
ncbi:unnamed protein product [marine sediment metagenome]|uniref:Uncharacterized protein n=1 Tax=marine sediment metagenome TaxID=412755 RepID=X0YQ82_9ZZZZ